ncbi:hypothetical protein EJ07DRAFT_179453 [Lizonia empirigonia]|nr:hypothetical protein EJ07DRAFT_179453 [Lizonia empirigonia]
MDALLWALVIVIVCFLLFGSIIAVFHQCARTAARNSAEQQEQRFHADELELEQYRDKAARWRALYMEARGQAARSSLHQHTSRPATRKLRRHRKEGVGVELVL